MHEEGIQDRSGGCNDPLLHHRKATTLPHVRSTHARYLVGVPMLCVCVCVPQAAGGVSHNGHGSMLDLKIEDTGVRSIIAVGSQSQVQDCVAALQAGGQ